MFSMVTCDFIVRSVLSKQLQWLVKAWRTHSQQPSSMDVAVKSCLTCSSDSESHLSPWQCHGPGSFCFGFMINCISVQALYSLAFSLVLSVSEFVIYISYISIFPNHSFLFDIVRFLLWFFFVSIFLWASSVEASSVYMFMYLFPHSCSCVCLLCLCSVCSCLVSLLCLVSLDLTS